MKPQTTPWLNFGRLARIACTGALGVALSAAPFTFSATAAASLPLLAENPAFAEDIDTNPTPDALQLRIEETAAAYSEAVAQAQEAAEAVEENRQRIADLEREIPLQQERSDAAARELYKLQQQSMGIIDLLLSADSFPDFLTNLEYVNRISDANIAEISRLRDMKAELDERATQLEQVQADAEARAAEAKDALAEAQQARLEAQRRAREASLQASEMAAAGRTAQAFAQAPSDTAANAGDSTSASADSGGNGDGSSASNASNASEPAPAETTVVDDGANWMSEEDVFVGEWAGRIDAYLSGSPLAGQGGTFARAAWNYGVDPRWSPAIACLESSKGLYCFLPYNAWGWGSVSWGSWEEAIDAHVRGLARGYGYTISMDAARKYCPPNADYWYSFVSGQMNLI